MGGKLEEKILNGRKVWTLTSAAYLKAAVANVEEQLLLKRLKLPSRAITPMTQNYHPKLDTTPELIDDDITTYQEHIGVLRWAAELGRVDILMELSILSSYQSLPCQGHLKQVYHIFLYLKHKPKLTLYFNPEYPPIDPSWFENSDGPDTFRDQYRDAHEELPPEELTPTPLGRAINVVAYVDASHAANEVTRRSHTGFILFINRSPAVWYSKARIWNLAHFQVSL